MHFAKGEYILSNDADTIPEPDALMKYMNFFIHNRDMNTSAVTANMDVQNRSTMLGKSQTVEFSSIVELLNVAKLLSMIPCTLTVALILYIRRIS